VEINPVRLRDARHAQAGGESDMDPLPVETLFAMPERSASGCSWETPWRRVRRGARAAKRQDFNLGGDIPPVKVERAVKQYDNITTIGPL